MEKKSIEVQFKFASDGVTNTFSGYGAVFGNTDSYGDVIAPGAFTKTLADHKKAGTTPAMLLNHDFFALPIGLWQSLQEDDRGLKVSGIFLATQAGSDAYTAAKAGAITGLSIGFQVTGFDMSRDADGNLVRTINELKLMEVSLVTFPANAEARVADVKSAELDGIKSLIETLTSEIVELKAKIAKKDEDDDEDTSLEEDCDCDGDEDCDCDDDESEAETKYNQAALEAVRNLIVELKQERHG